MANDTIFVLLIWAVTSGLSLFSLFRRKDMEKWKRLVWAVVCLLPIFGPIMYVLWSSEDPGPHGRDGDTIGFDASTHQTDL